MDSLVSTEWLMRNLDRSDLVVLDATRHLPGSERDPRADFEAAHIPGAHFLDLPSLHDPQAPVANTLPGRAQVAERLGALGVGPEDAIVLYDDSRLASAARAWFILRTLGHGQLAILDGGWAKWHAEARPLAHGTDAPERSDYRVPDGAPTAAVRTKAAMLANLATRAEQVVDARDAERFRSDVDDAVHGLPGGHIPGARNLFFRDVFRDDGTYRSPAELRALFVAQGIDPDRPVVATCGSGMTASVLLFALHLAGAPDTALYDGSWSEWGADPATPKETGEPA